MSPGFSILVSSGGLGTNYLVHNTYFVPHPHPLGGLDVEFNANMAGVGSI